jgi:hypothetical protein
MSHIKSSRSKQLATLHMTFQTIGHVKKINGRDLAGHAMDQQMVAAILYMHAMA